MNTKFSFATYIKTILFFVHHNGRIEIVGILLARLKYMSGSENVNMLIITGCCKKYIEIKNHDLCKTIFIVLILSFLLVLYLQRRTFKIKELMCILKDCG